MNLFDIIIAAVLIFFPLKGLLRGFVNEAASLTALLLGGWLAYRYYPLLSTPIQARLHIPAHLSAFLAFMLLLSGVGIVSHVLGNIITTALNLSLLGAINRAGGLMTGAIEGAMLLSLFFSIGTATYMPEDLKNRIMASDRARFFAEAGGAILHIWRERPP